MKKKIDDLTVAEIRKYLCDKNKERFNGSRCMDLDSRECCILYNDYDYQCMVMYDGAKEIEVEEDRSL